MSDYFRAKEAADKMVMYIIAGHSCNDCRNYFCPFEDIKYKIPNINGVRICQKWSD